MNLPVWDDIKDFGHELHNKWWERYRETTLENSVVPINGLGANGSTDATGALTLPIFTNKIGRETLIGRVIVSADSYTPAAPWSAGYAYLFIGEQWGGIYHDFLPNAPGQQVFPNVAEYSSRNAIRLGYNDTLSLYVVGGPVSKNISAFVWGEALPNNAVRKII